MKYALVTDGLWRKSISVIRSLGKADYNVSVMGDSIFTTGFFTRFTKKRFISPEAAKDKEQFGKKLTYILKNYPFPEKPVLFPMEDASLMWVSEHEEELKKYSDFLIPPRKALLTAEDKLETMRAAKREGIPHPFTWEPETVEDFIDIINKIQGDNIIVKPRTGCGSSGIIYGKSLSDDEWKDHWNKYGRLLIQDRVPKEGHGIGVGLLMDKDGECKAAFVHERLKQYPISGGPSTDRRSIHNEKLINLSIKLLKSLSFKGIGMVEWKEDIRDGIPKLMEINPRFWGSLELAVRSGVDFPVLYAKASKGEEIKGTFDYEENVRVRWMIPGDILRHMSEPKDKKEKLSVFLKGLPKDAEEWDKKDVRGSIACVICPALLVINPKYWKYLKRK